MPVDSAVVDLGIQRKTSFRDTFHVVQSLNDIGFPQGPPPVQRSRVQAGDLDTKLAPVPRAGQGDMTQVEFKVEMFRMGG